MNVLLFFVRLLPGSFDICEIVLDDGEQSELETFDESVGYGFVFECSVDSIVLALSGIQVGFISSFSAIIRDGGFRSGKGSFITCSIILADTSIGSTFKETSSFCDEGIK